MRARVEGLEIGDPVPVPPVPRPESEIVENWRGSPDEPLVSIVCHSYNHADYIENALNGFLMQQTDFRFEVVVHDDASSDGTAAIVEKYAAKYPTILRPILQTENQFRRGKRPPFFSFPASKGKYIALCEGDDYWLDHHKISVQANFLESHPEISVCGHDALIVQNGMLLKSSKLLDSQKRDFDSRDLQKGGYILSATAMFVNKIAEFAPEHSQILNGDNLIFSRLGEFGGAKYLENLGPAAYRVHAGGVWSLLDEQQKTAARINTDIWISKYYERTGDLSVSRHFSHKAIERVLTDAARISVRDFFSVNFCFLRVFIARKFPVLFDRLRRFARK